MEPRQKSGKPAVCIIAQNAYGAMDGAGRGHVGGAEHQTTLLARWLAQNGFPVSLITWDEGQPDEKTIDGVRVVKMCRPDAGLPGLRFFFPRMTSLFSAMRRADAGVYYHNSAEHVTGLAAGWCRRHGRKFVYSVASDVAADAALPVMRKPHERALYRYGLRHADRLIVQTERQRTMLRDGFGLDSAVLPMPCPGPSREMLAETPPPPTPHVAWVGRLVSLKRLEWFLDVAEKVPEVTFDVVAANIDGTEYSRNLLARAQSIKNVVWHGPVPRDRMPGVYQAASALCCTSIYEGFPNTFLEAWSYGRPVVTTFDPDNLIARMNLGAVAQSPDELAAAIRELVVSPAVWAQKSRQARDYYLTHHRLEVAMPRFGAKFVEAWSQPVSPLPHPQPAAA